MPFKIVPLVVAIAVFAICPAAPACFAQDVPDAKKEQVQWRTDYNAARKEALAKKLPILIFFHGKLSPPCQALDSTFFQIPSVAKYINRHWIPLKVQGHDAGHAQLMQMVGVDRFPTIVLASFDGKVLPPSPIAGMKDRVWLENELRKISDDTTQPTSPSLTVFGIRISLSPTEGEAEQKAVAPAKIDWRFEYESARKEALNKKLPMLLFFFEDVSPPCHLFEANLQTEKLTHLVNERFVPVKISMASQKLLQSFEVDRFPTLILTGPDGTVLPPSPLIGFRDPKNLQDELERFLSSLTRKDAAPGGSDWIAWTSQSPGSDLSIAIAEPAPPIDSFLLKWTPPTKGLPPVTVREDGSLVVPSVSQEKPLQLPQKVEEIPVPRRETAVPLPPGSLPPPVITILDEHGKVIRQFSADDVAGNKPYPPPPPQSPFAGDEPSRIVVAGHKPYPLPQSPFGGGQPGMAPPPPMLAPFRYLPQSPLAGGQPDIGPPPPLLAPIQSKEEAAERVRIGQLLFEAVSCGDKAHRLIAQKKFAEAEVLLQKAITLHREASGANDVDLAMAMRALAELYYATNRYRQAEEQHLLSLAILENQPGGKDNLDVALSLNLLARVCMGMNRFAEAEKLTRRSLEMRDALQPANHPDIASVLNNLGTICIRLKHFEESEAILKRALKMRLERFGKADPNVAQSFINLGSLYHQMRRFDASAAMFERGLAILESSDRADQNELFQLLSVLGHCYYEQQKHDEAERILARAQKVAESLPGDRAVDVAGVINSRAKNFWQMQRYDESEECYQLCLEILDKVPHNEEILVPVLSNLAALYTRMERYSEAEAMLQKSLELGETTLGEFDREMAAVFHNLAGLYREMDRNAEAEQFYLRSVKSLEASDQPADLAIVLGNFASFYREVDCQADAMLLYERCLKLLETTRGKDHLDVARCLEGMAQLHWQMDQTEQAEPLMRRALAIREAKQGKEHADVADCLGNLAFLVMMQGRWTDAELLLDRCLKIREAQPGQRRLGSTLQRLTMVYLLTGRMSEAETLYERSLHAGDDVDADDGWE